MGTDYTLHRGTDARGVEYLLTVWSDGTHELATRTPAERTWSPPVSLMEVPPSVDTCTACRGRGTRIHGWAVCPGPCRDCDGRGVVARGPLKTGPTVRVPTQPGVGAA